VSTLVDIGSEGDALTGGDDGDPDAGLVAGLAVSLSVALALLLCILYIALRFGPSKTPTLCLYYSTHSNAKFRWLYLPEGQRERLRTALYPVRAHGQEDRGCDEEHHGGNLSWRTD